MTTFIKKIQLLLIAIAIIAVVFGPTGLSLQIIVPTVLGYKFARIIYAYYKYFRFKTPLPEFAQLSGRSYQGFSNGHTYEPTKTLDTVNSIRFADIPGNRFYNSRNSSNKF